MAIVKPKFTILIGIVYAALVITTLSVIKWNEIEPATKIALSSRY